MNILSFFKTVVGKKIIVAITGLFMIMFLIMHLLGNLQIFSGPDAINQYAALLKSMPKIVWSFRIALIMAVFAHISLTISLTNANKRARPEGYQVKQSRKASFMSRTMMISGLTVLAFIAYHLAHYTIGLVNPEYMQLTDAQGRHHVYNMMVMGFSNPVVSAFYIVAQLLLASHVSHGISSATRTLGLGDQRLYLLIQRIGVIFAGIIAVLYISIPVSVLIGCIHLDY